MNRYVINSPPALLTLSLFINVLVSLLSCLFDKSWPFYTLNQSKQHARLLRTKELMNSSFKGEQRCEKKMFICPLNGKHLGRQENRPRSKDGKERTGNLRERETCCSVK